MCRHTLGSPKCTYFPFLHFMVAPAVNLVHLGGQADCVAINCGSSPHKLESVSELHCGTPRERRLICGGNLSHKQPRGDFNIYSAVCSAYVSFGKQLTLAHYTQMKADLQAGQRPHSLCEEVSPSYEAMASNPLRPHHQPLRLALLMHMEQQARVHCKREGPGWHDVYCTSIWYWCILRCKQGFKLYAPPCQRLRVTLTIWATEEKRGRPGLHVVVFFLLFFFFSPLCVCIY